MNRKENAIILAAGFSSRFAPLSYEKPKALIEVKGEVLIERQIRQLKEAGIHDITLVVGYKAEMFGYLREKFGVDLILNDDYSRKNNLSSIYRVKHKLKDTYICSADNYFTRNVFVESTDHAYYSAEYASGKTEEWCMGFDEEENITEVNIGGEDCWYMIGHAFFTEGFTEEFMKLLEDTYHTPEADKMLWEHMYIGHLDRLRMKIRKYPHDVIKEFDSLSELKEFDESYQADSRSLILKEISKELDCRESEIEGIQPLNTIGDINGFTFHVGNEKYEYNYVLHKVRRVE